MNGQPTIGWTSVCSNAGAPSISASVLLQTDVHPIVGCPFTPVAYSPCVSIRWVTAATQTTVRNVPVLLQTSVGLCLNALGKASPASYMNFVIANGVVAVPVYGTGTELAAIDALQTVFPDREVIGVPSLGLMGCGDAGGGSFHCITQQEPAS